MAVVELSLAVATLLWEFGFEEVAVKKHSIVVGSGDPINRRLRLRNLGEYQLYNGGIMTSN